MFATSLGVGNCCAFPSSEHTVETHAHSDVYYISDYFSLERHVMVLVYLAVLIASGTEGPPSTPSTGSESVFSPADIDTKKLAHIVTTELVSLLGLKNRRGHWLCWMSTGRNNGVM